MIKRLTIFIIVIILGVLGISSCHVSEVETVDSSIDNTTDTEVAPIDIVLNPKSQERIYKWKQHLFCGTFLKN